MNHASMVPVDLTDARRWRPHARIHRAPLRPKKPPPPPPLVPPPLAAGEDDLSFSTTSK